MIAQIHSGFLLDLRQAVRNSFLVNEEPFSCRSLCAVGYEEFAQGFQEDLILGIFFRNQTSKDF